MGHKFKVHVMEVHKQEYFVDAENEEEAKNLALNGGKDDDDKVIIDECSFEYISTLQDFTGVPVSVYKIDISDIINLEVDSYNGTIWNCLLSNEKDKIGRFLSDGSISIEYKYAHKMQDIMSLLRDYLEKNIYLYSGLAIEKRLKIFFLMIKK